MSCQAYRFIAALLLCVSAGCTTAPKQPAPLFQGLGQNQITTLSHEAQEYFTQGLILCFGFNQHSTSAPKQHKQFEAAWRHADLKLATKRF